MILSSSTSQPYALLVFSLLGIILGLIYMQNYFVSSFLIKKAYLRHIFNVVYVLLYLICFVLCEYYLFDYNLHIYHYFIAVFCTIAISFVIYMPIHKYKELITAKCDAFIKKVKSGKLYNKITK